MRTHPNGFGVMRVGNLCLRVTQTGSVIMAEPKYVKTMERLEREHLGDLSIPPTNEPPRLDPRLDPRPDPHQPGEAARS